MSLYIYIHVIILIINLFLGTLGYFKLEDEVKEEIGKLTYTEKGQDLVADRLRKWYRDNNEIYTNKRDMYLEWNKKNPKIYPVPPGQYDDTKDFARRMHKISDMLKSED